MSEQAIHVYKIGGSLLDLVDLTSRTRTCMDAGKKGVKVVVVGGGVLADQVRMFDRHFQLTQERAHWLSIQAMQMNAHLMQAVMPGSELVASVDSMRASVVKLDFNELAQRVFIVDPLLWLRADEVAGYRIPYRWSFTSDSIAAHMAARLDAVSLTLLKSVLPKGDLRADRIADATEQEIVDAEFAAASKTIGCVSLINLRHESPTSQEACCVLR